MAKTPKLTVLFEKLRGQTFELELEKMTVGRKDGMNIVLKDGSVSGYHADIIRVEKDGETSYILRDNDSTNGTRVNNQPVTEHVLKNSDLITFGNVEVLFEGDRPDGVSTSDFSHITHTIDISAIEEKTSSVTKTLRNFDPRMAEAAKKKVAMQRFMVIGTVALAIGLIVLAYFVITAVLSR